MEGEQAVTDFERQGERLPLPRFRSTDSAPQLENEPCRTRASKQCAVPCFDYRAILTRLHIPGGRLPVRFQECLTRNLRAAREQ